MAVTSITLAETVNWKAQLTAIKARLQAESAIVANPSYIKTHIDAGITALTTALAENERLRAKINRDELAAQSTILTTAIAAEDAIINAP